MAKPDADLVGLWEYVPEGIPGVERTGGIDVNDYSEMYGEPPYVFRAYRQNGSRVWLRLRRGDADALARATVPHADRFIERRAYASDLRRGVYWRRVT
jgi:hypothetical protein